MPASRFKPDSFALGFALVGVGVLWTLSNQGRVDLLAAMRMGWPLVLLVWGIAELVNTAVSRRRS